MRFYKGTFRLSPGRRREAQTLECLSAGSALTDVNHYAIIFHVDWSPTMKILVLGGCGTQGRTTIVDLLSDPDVEQVLCGDITFEPLEKIAPFIPGEKLIRAELDVSDHGKLAALFHTVDVVIDLLPVEFQDTICKTALDAKTSVVHTNYTYGATALDEGAKRAGISIMPECGLDPGIDLVLYGRARQQFDKVESILSYCGGFPEKSACDNPLNYKLSWIWRTVLSSTMRESKIIRDSSTIHIPVERQHDEEFVHTIDFPGLGKLEAIPNGDAIFFTDLLGVTKSLTTTGRYALRWPGWSEFWRPLKYFGFLSTEPVPGLGSPVSPREMVDKLMENQLTYKDDEKDLVAMLNIFEGTKDNQRIRATSRLLIERDLDTGLMAMSKGVGCTAAIVAKMVARGDISKTGLLSPVKDIPGDQFLASLAKRKIQVVEETEIINDRTG